MGITEVQGSAKLVAWIEKNGLSKRRVSRDLGVSAPTLIDWLYGTKVPTPNNRMAIRKYTDGSVAEEDWVTESELADRKRADNIQRFEPATGESDAIEDEPNPSPEPARGAR